MLLKISLYLITLTIVMFCANIQMQILILISIVKKTTSTSETTLFSLLGIFIEQKGGENGNLLF